MRRNTSRSWRTAWLALLVAGGALALTGPAALAARKATFTTMGDIFLSMHDGTIQWRTADGKLVKTLTSVTTGHAEGMGFDSNLDLYVCHFFASDLQSGNTVAKFGEKGDLLGTFGDGYDCNPKSIVFDLAGTAYVGQADCSRDLMRMDAGGTMMARLDVGTELRGSDWIDLAADQCTMLYTSQGFDVMRYNVCTNTQMPNFNLLPLPDMLDGAHALRILPDGGVLVANFSVIARLDASGALMQTYNVPGRNNCWLGLDLDIDETSFWATNWCTSDVTKFDLDTGAVLFSFNTGTAAQTVKAVKVKRGPTIVPSEAGRMTGGGSIFSSYGRITHGFELHCDASDLPNNLEVNWGGNHFHLEHLDAAECSDDPTIDPAPPEAPFDTYRGRGTGRYNGVSGATAEWTFTDAGEPGKRDTMTITIRDASGNVVVTGSNRLTFGNHQAHAH